MPKVSKRRYANVYIVFARYRQHIWSSRSFCIWQCKKSFSAIPDPDADADCCQNLIIFNLGQVKISAKYQPNLQLNFFVQSWWQTNTNKFWASHNLFSRGNNACVKTCSSYIHSYIHILDYWIVLLMYFWCNFLFKLINKIIIRLWILNSQVICSNYRKTLKWQPCVSMWERMADMLRWYSQQIGSWTLHVAISPSTPCFSVRACYCSPSLVFDDIDICLC